MKTFHQFCFAIVLTLVLALSAVAGEIHTPGVAAPGDVQLPGLLGEIETPGLLGDISTPGLLALLFGL